MSCENCCESFIGTYEGFYCVKNNNRKRLCRCCKNEYIALGWEFMGSVEDIELVKIEAFWKTLEEKIVNKEVCGECSNDIDECNCGGYNCTDENRCEECCYCLRTRPCECGCGLLGGTCIPEEDYETADCVDCGNTHVLDKMEMKDEMFYCKLCFVEEEK